jgi:hypothetical protein
MKCSYDALEMILLYDIDGAMRLDHSKDMSLCACFNLHQLRFQRINADCVEVVELIRHVCVSTSRRIGVCSAIYPIDK